MGTGFPRVFYLRYHYYPIYFPLMALSRWVVTASAPLAEAAGGKGACGEVFRGTSDPDYQLLLASIERGKATLDKKPRYGSEGFEPNHQYVREMKRYGIVPDSFQWSEESLNVFQSDQAYWESFWYRPDP